MFLFIFESIGTSELILIGIIALMFLGPRKLPQIAKTIGKTMADFRNTTNEFKSTWEREVNFEEEAQALRTGELPDEPVARMTPVSDEETIGISAPEIKEIDKDAFDDLIANQSSDQEDAADALGEKESEDYMPENEPLSDKRTWL